MRCVISGAGSSGTPLNPDDCDTDIENVTVASHQAEFSHHDPIANMNVSDPTDFHVYPEAKRRFYSALAEGDEGELAISVPHNVSIKQVRQSAPVVAWTAGSRPASSLETLRPVWRAAKVGRMAAKPHTRSKVPLLAATPEPATPGHPHAAPALAEFAPIIVNIEYTLRHPAEGLQFVLPTEAYPHVSPDIARTVMLHTSFPASPARIHDALGSRCSTLLGAVR